MLLPCTQDSVGEVVWFSFLYMLDINKLGFPQRCKNNIFWPCVLPQLEKYPYSNLMCFVMQMFQDSQKLVEQVSRAVRKATPQQAKLAGNVASSLAQELQDMSAEFRSTQSRYLDSKFMIGVDKMVTLYGLTEGYVSRFDYQFERKLLSLPAISSDSSCNKKWVRSTYRVTFSMGTWVQAGSLVMSAFAW